MIIFRREAREKASLRSVDTDNCILQKSMVLHVFVADRFDSSVGHTRCREDVKDTPNNKLCGVVNPLLFLG